MSVRVCVLDVETRLSDAARALLATGERATVSRSALLEVTAASTLEFEIGETLGGLGMTTTLAAEVGEAAVLEAVDRALLRVGGGVVVTHNGLAHDLPVLGRRAMHHWMFDAAGILAWWRDPPGGHVDTMLAFGDGAGRGPSLADAAAGLGFPGGTPARTLSKPVAAELVKGQVDVVATALLYLHLEAARRRSAGWLADAWRELSRFLLTPGVRAPHLMPLAGVGLGLADERR